MSFNTRSVTIECLESIFRHSCARKTQVIVVDNASVDGSADAIERQFSEVEVIRNSTNLGFAAGQNLGIAAARGRAILVLNSDIVFQDDAIGVMADELLDRQPSDRIAGIGPRVLHANGDLAPSARTLRLTRGMIFLSVLNAHWRFKRLLPEEKMRRHAAWLFGRMHDNYAVHDLPRESDVIDGMCVMFRREVLVEVGLFDERYFFDTEIYDLCHRIKRAGRRMLYYPPAHVVHIGAVSRKSVSRIVADTERSRLTYVNDYHPEWLPYTRRVLCLVVGSRLAWMRLRSLIRAAPPGGQGLVSLYREILGIAREYVPGARRIATLPARIP